MKNLITRYLTRVQPEAKAPVLNDVLPEPQPKPNETTICDTIVDDEDDVVKPITRNKKIPDIFTDESSSATVVGEPADKEQKTQSEEDVVPTKPEVITILDSDVSCDKPVKPTKAPNRSRSNSPNEERKQVRSDSVKASPVLVISDDSADDADDDDAAKPKSKLMTPKVALRRKSRPKLRRVTPSRTTQDGIIGLKVRSPNTN